MKIYECVRDAKLMRLSELKAIDERVRAVQAKNPPYGQEQPTKEETEEVKAPAKKGSKKKKEGLRSDKNRVLPETWGAGGVRFNNE